jgi:hypothetical protein
MGVALAIALVALLVAHAAIVATLVRRARWLRALAALCVPPLAPWWAWDLTRPLALAWLTSFGLYALLAVIAATLPS